MDWVWFLFGFLVYSMLTEFNFDFFCVNEVSVPVSRLSRLRVMFWFGDGVFGVGFVMVPAFFVFGRKAQISSWFEITDRIRFGAMIGIWIQIDVTLFMHLGAEWLDLSFVWW
ncbi:hypothetical protein ZIOFF_069757 [Zingiber officinale]|uniref:Uncharacterized protein n=1 Tax=Zingiber officinale TaxID=94328 RepID=A0A8J5ED08_ZINOF|nr:hypothetical protein ZIOFF_069757 [Zingiber officinale]